MSERNFSILLTTLCITLIDMKAQQPCVDTVALQYLHTEIFLIGDDHYSSKEDDLLQITASFISEKVWPVGGVLCCNAIYSVSERSFTYIYPDLPQIQTNFTRTQYRWK